MAATTLDTERRSSGFGNLLGRENKVWWKSQRWLVQTLLAVGGLDGFLAFVLFLLPPMMAVDGRTAEPLEAGIQLFFGLGAFALAMGAELPAQMLLPVGATALLSLLCLLVALWRFQRSEL